MSDRTDGTALVSAGDAVRRATAVVVTYNSAAHIAEFLDALALAAPRTQLDLVVVDNGSTDGTAALLDERGVVPVQTGSNLGYAGAINVGLRGVDADDPVVILNPDLQVAPRSVDLLLDALERPGTGIAAPRVLTPEGRATNSLHREPSLAGALGDAILGARMPGRPATLSEHILREPTTEQAVTGWASGAALAISPACRAAVGGWDERYFLYSEEVDFTRRARDAGFTVRFVPSAEVRHVEAGSGRSLELSALMAVNRVRYYRSWHGPVATAAYRGIAIAHNALRARSAPNRACVRALLRRSSLPAAHGQAAPPPETAQHAAGMAR